MKAETLSWRVLVMRIMSSSILQGRKFWFWTSVKNVVFTKFYRIFVSYIQCIIFYYQKTPKNKKIIVYLVLYKCDDKTIKDQQTM